MSTRVEPMNTAAAPGANRTAKLSLTEKWGYGLGDTGFNLYWATVAAFLAGFYTDVFGLSAALAATLFFVTKISLAFMDPVMGAIADRTQTRFGKFRPYLLFTGLPLACAAVLTFTTPNLSGGGKLAWAYGTYTIMMLLYTVLSTPYSSLSGVMTARSQDRTALISSRFVLASVGGFFVNAYTLDIVHYFGGADETKGWQYTMALYGLIATVIFIITFLTTKERIAPPVAQKTSPLNDIKDLLGNHGWLILIAISFVVNLSTTMRAASAYYYFHYFLARPDLLGAYLGCQAFASLVGALITPLLTQFGSKEKILCILYFVFAVLCAVMAFIPKPEFNGMVTVKAGQERVLRAEDLLGQLPANAQLQWQKKENLWWVSSQQVDLPGQNGASIVLKPEKDMVVSLVATLPDATNPPTTRDSSAWPDAIKWVFILNLVACLVLGPKAPLIWSMYADSADYTEWKTGRRATAMTFAAAGFAQKIGATFGTAGMLWVLAGIGYVANQAQSGASQFGIVLLQTAIPGAFALIASAVALCYKLNAATLETIQEDLKNRNNG